MTTAWSVFWSRSIDLIVPAITPATLKSAPVTSPNALSSWILYVARAAAARGPEREHQERPDGEQDRGAGEDPLHCPVGTSFGLHGKPDSTWVALVPAEGPRSIDPGQRSP